MAKYIAALVFTGLMVLTKFWSDSGPAEGGQALQAHLRLSFPEIFSKIIQKSEPTASDVQIKKSRLQMISKTEAHYHFNYSFQNLIEEGVAFLQKGTITAVFQEKPGEQDTWTLVRLSRPRATQVEFQDETVVAPGSSDPETMPEPDESYEVIEPYETDPSDTEL